MSHSRFLQSGHRLRRALAAVALVGATLGVVAPSVAEPIAIGLRSGADTMDPHFDALGSTVQLHRNIYDTLVSRDGNLDPIPGLATEWRLVDDVTWEFTLRQGVVFHDGSPFTAADVVYTFERVPEAAGPRGGKMIYMTGIEEVVAIDDHTVHIITNAPTPLLPRNLAQIFILPTSTADASTEDFNAGRAAIGTGPYRLVEYVPLDRMVVERFDDYWGEAHPWSQVTFLEIASDQARVAALLSGRVALIDAVPTVDIGTLERDNRFALFSAPSVYIFQLYLDTVRDDPPGVRDAAGNPVTTNPMKDPRVREAISLSINRQAIVDRILQGYGAVPTQVTTTGFFGTSPNLEERPFDPARARALLAEAGYPDGFQVDLFCTSDRLPNDGDVCAALGGFFSRVGIAATVNARPRTVYFPAFAAREFGISMSGWGSLSGETSYILQSLAHSRDNERRLGGSNHMLYSNAEVDALIMEAVVTLDDDARQDLLARAMEIYVEDHGVIPVVNLYSIWAGRADKVVYNARSDDETHLGDLRPVSTQ